MKRCTPGAGADLVRSDHGTTAVSSASFQAVPVSVREARRFLRGFLADHGRDDLIDRAQLALSEIATNAVLHAHTDFTVTAALSADGGVHVAVTDQNRQLPVQRNYADQATTGRGMELVAAVTADCGIHNEGLEGKTVWFVVRSEPETADTAPDAWCIDPAEAARSAGGDVRIVLLGMPATLWLAAREHHDALLRELALYGQEHPEDAPTPERFALADRARAWISTRVVAELERHAARPDAPRHLRTPTGVLPDAATQMDLDLHVAPDAAVAFAALQDLLDTAERLAAAGKLLARPGLPELVAVRDWACEQGIAQLTGVLPSPWPGTAQERFTTEVRDRHRSQPPDWDATVVTEAASGAVAADDANRIIAVSPSLAALLGWAVDELIGRRVVALIPPELREAHVAGFTRHLTSGSTSILGVPLRLPVLRADGAIVQSDVLIEQAPSATGRAVYIAWIAPTDQPGPATPT